MTYYWAMTSARVSVEVEPFQAEADLHRRRVFRVWRPLRLRRDLLEVIRKCGRCECQNFLSDSFMRLQNQSL